MAQTFKLTLDPSASWEPKKTGEQVLNSGFRTDPEDPFKPAVDSSGIPIDSDAVVVYAVDEKESVYKLDIDPEGYVTKIIAPAGQAPPPAGVYSIEYVTGKMSVYEEPAETGAAAKTATGTPPVVEPAYAEVKEIIDLLLDRTQAKLDQLGVADFATGKKYNTEIDGYIDSIKGGSTVTFQATPFPDRPDCKLKAAPRNAAVVKALKNELADEIKTLPKEKPVFGQFLIAGYDKKLTDKNLILFNNLRGISEILGLKAKFNKKCAALKAASLGTSEAQDDEDDEDDEDAESTEDTSGGAGTDSSRERSRSRRADAAEENSSDDEDVEEEPAPESAPGQTIGFYVMIFGADKGTDAEIEIEFPEALSDGGETTYKIKSIKGSMFGKSRGIHVREDELIALWKANSGQEATVRIKAVPATGGDAGVVEETILIRWPLYKNVNSPPLLKFRFSETTGTRTYTGLPAGEGSGGAKDDRKKAAEVAELYYTKSGGIKKSTIDTTVDAVGSTYRFTFDVRPMLVPIEIDVPEGTKLTERKKLSEGAVPHWIFLSGRSAGRDSSGSAGVSGAGKKAVNIAVSRFAIKTKGAWIAVPNVGTPWDKGTFRVDIADNAGGAGPGGEKAAGLAPILGIAEINKMNLDKRAIENAVREALFGSSAAWSKLGISDNCWAKDPSVSGTGGVTRREITYRVGASA